MAYFLKQARERNVYQNSTFSYSPSPDLYYDEDPAWFLIPYQESLEKCSDPGSFFYERPEPGFDNTVVHAKLTGFGGAPKQFPDTVTRRMSGMFPSQRGYGMSYWHFTTWSVYRRPNGMAATFYVSLQLTNGTFRISPSYTVPAVHRVSACCGILAVTGPNHDWAVRAYDGMPDCNFGGYAVDGYNWSYAIQREGNPYKNRGQITDWMIDACEDWFGNPHNLPYTNLFSSSGYSFGLSPDGKDYLVRMHGFFYKKIFNTLNEFSYQELPSAFSMMSAQEATDLTPANMPDVPPDAFIFREDVRFPDRQDSLMLGLRGNGYYLNSLVQHAYLNAVQQIPKMNDNNIANFLEIASFIYELVVNHKIEIPNSLSSLWMSYRYQYKTTRSDIEEAIEFMGRHYDLNSTPLKVYGQSVAVVLDSEVICRCKILVQNEVTDTIGKVFRSLYKYGLTPSFYVFWDMVPMSFIADWFLPIGAVTEVLDAKIFYGSEYYKITQVCFSLSYNRGVDKDVYNVYSRWPSESPPELNSMYWFEPPSASSRTVGCRILDAASMIIGH